MAVYKSFIRIEIYPQMQAIAQLHAKRRTESIVRQFVPRNSPLSHIESNYIGALGEIAVTCYFQMNIHLTDNYNEHQVDSGDLYINELVYDIKTEAIPNKYYRKLYYGEIQSHEPYGCRVWTSKHQHHLNKYTGGIIFVAVPIPNNAKDERLKNILRERIVDHAKQVIIVGYVEQKYFEKMKPSWYSPKNPISGKRRKYNSSNYIFHHSEINSIISLKDGLKSRM